MKKTNLTRSLLAACSIVALSAVAYGCSSGISQSEADRQAAEAAAAAAAEAEAAAKKAAEEAAAKAEADRLAAIEAARTAINMAATAADAQAAKDAVDDIATATEAAGLQAAVDARIMALDMMAREAAQKMALADAAGMIDTSDLSTQAAVDAARAAIVMLRGALAAAADVSDADKAMYMSMLDDAVMAVDTAQGGIDTATRRMNQMDALESASMALQTALAALAGQAPTQAQIDAASSALADLNSAIGGAADLTADETATYQREADNAAAPISTAQTSLDDAEEKAEEEAARKAAEEAAAAAAAMAVTASKLYAGISVPTATDANTADTDTATGTRFAGYVTVADTPTGASVGDIVVGISDDDDVALSEDKDAMVDDHHGWTGMMFTASPMGGGTYEAVVYSNVGESTEGLKFGSAADDDDYQYTLDAGNNMELTMDDTNAGAGWAARVASPSFDQSAGVKEFELGTNMVRLMIAGSYHGVSGTYNCTPAASSTCAVQVAADGFNLGGTADADNAFTAAGGTWTFTPSNAEARIMSTPDANYASYGWWIHKAADDGDFTASAFVADRGTGEGAASGITALQGTATYMGGAAGKYALRSSTGGTNDAGHFTADAMLSADFGDDMITGTIDNFMGADGMARDWSVELNETDISDVGVIDGLGGDANDEQVGTVWTIGETAADAGGQWSGALYNNEAVSGVPQVATGTFYSTYGEAGRMVGAFGANEQ